LDDLKVTSLEQLKALEENIGSIFAEKLGEAESKLVRKLESVIDSTNQRI
jgi:hypothetical protein